MSLDFLSQAFDGPRITFPGHGDDGPAGGIGRDRHVIMPAGFGGLVDGEFPDLREILPGHDQVHVPFAQTHDPMKTHPGQARHGSKGHLPAKGEDQGLEEQRKAGELPSEWRFHLAHRPIGQSYTRHPNLQDALVLEEVEVPVALHPGVMHGMFSGRFGMSKSAAGHKVHGNRQRPGPRIEGHIPYMPGGFNPQGCLEQLGLRHDRHSSSGSLAVFYP